MSRRVMFLMVCIVSMAVAAGYVTYAVRHRAALAAASSPDRALHMDAPTSVAGQEMLQSASATRAALLYRSTAVNETYGRLALASLAPGEQIPTFLALRCERVHFAAGWGVCLTAERGVLTTYSAEVFDAQFIAPPSSPFVRDTKPDARGL